MANLFDIFSALGPWGWFIVGLVLFALETVIPGVHFLWYGVSAIIVGFLAVTLGMSWHFQLVTFGLLSVLTLQLVRRFAAPGNTPTDEPTLNDRGQQYVGRSFIVEEALTAGRGKLRVGDTLWLAEGPDMPRGTRAKVTAIRGTVLVVERDRG